MKKSTIAAIVVAAMVLLGSSGVYATGQIARSNAITESDALNFACVDAGVNPDDVYVTKMEFDFDHGKFVYEIEFTVEGNEYDYVIDSSNGQVLDRGLEKQYTGAYNSNPGTGPNPGFNTAISEGDVIGIENAKTIALQSAGLKEGDVVFSKAKLEREDGRTVYDIDFYVYGKAEYGYEIDASTGEIMEEGFEAWEEDDYVEYVAAEKLQNISGNSASSGNSGGSSASSAISGGGAASSGSSGSSVSGSSGKTSSNSGSSGSSSSASSSSSGKTSGSSSSGSSGTITSGDDVYKVENGVVYEKDDGRWEREDDKKVVNGKVYEKDDGRWEADDDDDDDWDDDDDDDDDDD